MKGFSSSGSENSYLIYFFSNLLIYFLSINTSGDIWKPISKVSYFWVPIETISTGGIIDYCWDLIEICFYSKSTIVLVSDWSIEGVLQWLASFDYWRLSVSFLSLLSWWELNFFYDWV